MAFPSTHEEVCRMSLYLGIDWSSTKHDLVALNEHGAIQAHLTFPHSPDGFLNLDKAVRQLGATSADYWVGLETAYNLLIDFLWAHAYTQVYVLPPSVVKSSRGSYSDTAERAALSAAL